jgi:uncharacterized membrane protein (UPF0127 family)
MVLKVKALKNELERIKGLIGVKDVHPVYFQTRFGIHTFGVLSPVDVIILDDEYRVVKIMEKLKPFRIFVWNPKYENVIEAPSKTIKENKIKLGEKITLQFI